MATKHTEYSYYRLNFLKRTVWPVFCYPILLTFLSLRLFPACSNAIPTLLTPLFYLAVIVVYNTIRVQVSELKHRREAARLGAQLVPRVQGKWIGNLDLVMKKDPKVPYLGHRLEDMFNELGARTINVRVLWVDNFISMDERVVKYVLATGFENFEKGKKSHEMRESFLGAGIFNRDGDVWKAHRATARPFFAKERIKDFDTFERHASHAIEAIERHQALGQSRPGANEKGVNRIEPFDAQALFARFTIDLGAAFLFSTSLQTLSLPLPRAYNAPRDTPKPPTDPESQKDVPTSVSFTDFTSAFEACQGLVIARQRNETLWPLAEWGQDKMEAPMKVIRDWLDPIVEGVLEKKRNNKMMGGEPPSVDECNFLEFLAESTDDVEMIRTELLNILLAARDSTNSLLTFVIYMFTQNPDVVARLRAEILSVCPPGQIPSYEDIKGMRYLRAVINETFRVFPPVHTMIRASGPRACAIPLPPTATRHRFATPSSQSQSDHSTGTSSSQPDQPLYMPPHTSISLVPLLMHHRKDFWGPDADEFDPDRWIDARSERLLKNPLMFVPFNAGPRICLGQHFTLNQASYFLVRLLQTYSSFELAPDAQPPNSAPPAHWKEGRGRARVEKIFFSGAFTLFVKGGLWVRFKKPEGEDI